MNTSKWLRLLLAAGLAFPTASASAQTLDSNESPRAWFVELSSPPTVEGTSVAHDEEREAVVPRGREEVRPQVHRAVRLRHALQRHLGFVAPGDVMALSQIDGVRGGLAGAHVRDPRDPAGLDPDLVTALEA